MRKLPWPCLICVCACFWGCAGSAPTDDVVCQPNPCNDEHRGVCQEVNGEAVCYCDPSYEEDAQGRCVSSDPCQPNPCNEPHRGVCTANAGGAVCSCDPGYEEDAQGDCMAVVDCEPPCTTGFHCEDGGCQPNVCEPPCDDQETCLAHEENACVCGDTGESCQPGTHCEAGACVPDSCSPPCDVGQSCVDGICVDDVCDPPCEPGYHCVGDVCVSDPCDPTCATGEHCEGGVCIENQCDPPCAFDETCVDEEQGLCLCLDGCHENELILYVSPQGNDDWSGRFAEPEADDSDGPLRTLIGARAAVRRIKADTGLFKPVRVQMRAGVYRLTAPVEFTPEDSGTQQFPISYENYPAEHPVISGGRAINGWQVSGDRWTVTLPEVQNGSWYFTALWVDGERRQRARTPNAGYLYTAGNCTEAELARSCFHYSPGDLQAFQNPQDAMVEVVHIWSTSVHSIETQDTDQSRVILKSAAHYDFEELAYKQRYRVWNVFEALDEPGEWYLDRATGVLTYWPLPGEQPGSVETVAPVASQLLLFQGSLAAADPEYVAYLSFEGLRLLHTDWQPGDAGTMGLQAAVELPAAIEAEGAQYLEFRECELSHHGSFALWFQKGTHNSSVVRCEFADLGGGGVRIGMQKAPLNAAEEAFANIVDNCFIHDGGKILAGAVGICVLTSSYNEITHNEVCDFDYSGISLGWNWTMQPTTMNHNLVAHNYVHHIGRHVLSDLAGIYVTSISPGTQVIHNKVHNVFSYPYGYGGRGLYADGGCSEVLFKDNLIFNNGTGNFNQNFGENISVENNIFAFAGGNQIRSNWRGDPRSMTFSNNIVLFNNGWPLARRWDDDLLDMQSNLYWDTVNSQVAFDCRTLAERQAGGYDMNSQLADPLFSNVTGDDPTTFDFNLQNGSPALALGFVPFEFDAFGLYGDADWVALPRSIPRSPSTLPEPLPPPFDDGFETTPLGAMARQVVTYETPSGMTVRVSDETAATGTHSLKFQDMPAGAGEQTYEPHIKYETTIIRGTVRVDFRVLLQAGAIFKHEWRDNPESPYDAGPSLRIAENGDLTASGVYLTTLPDDVWISFEINSVVGVTADGLYDLTVQVSGQQAQVFEDLEGGQPLCRLFWIGFISPANVQTAYFLDDMSYQVE